MPLKTRHPRKETYINTTDVKCGGCEEKLEMNRCFPKEWKVDFGWQYYYCRNLSCKKRNKPMTLHESRQ